MTLLDCNAAEADRVTALNSSPRRPSKHDFQGCFIPAPIIAAVEMGELDLPEMWVWLMINSFQKGGLRCFMSNEAIAERARLKKRQVQNILSKLESAGYLRRWMEGDRRILHTTPMQYRHELTQKSGGDPCNPLHPPMQSIASPPCNGLHQNTDTTEEDSLSAKPLRGNGGQSVRPSAGRWKRLAIQLATAISQVRRVNYTSSITSWAKSLEMLHKKDKVEFIRIKRAMRWYCRELPSRHREKYFLVIESGATFRAKFSRLEDAIERDRTESAENAGYDSGQQEGEVRIVSTPASPKRVASVEDRFEFADGPCQETLESMRDLLKGPADMDLKERWLLTFEE